MNTIPNQQPARAIQRIFSGNVNLTTGPRPSPMELMGPAASPSAAGVTETAAVCAAMEKLSGQAGTICKLSDAVQDAARDFESAFAIAALYKEEIENRAKGEPAGLIGSDTSIAAELRRKYASLAYESAALKSAVAALHDYLQHHA